MHYFVKCFVKNVCVSEKSEQQRKYKSNILLCICKMWLFHKIDTKKMSVGNDHMHTASRETQISSDCKLP